MLREINKDGLEHLKHCESLVEQAKQIRGTWVIGYSHTADKSNVIDAPHEGMTITEEKATEVLLADIKPTEEAIANLVTTKLNDYQYAALVSFVFNIGVDNFKDSTMLRKINDGDLEGATEEFAKWVYTTEDNKKVISLGLVNRRLRESNLWNHGQHIASEFIESIPHKESVWGKPETWGMLIPTTACIFQAADGNGPFQWALACLTIAAGLLVFIYLLKKIREKST